MTKAYLFDYRETEGFDIVPLWLAKLYTFYCKGMNPWFKPYYDYVTDYAEVLLIEE